MSNKIADKKKGWRELPIGGMILDAGNSVEYDTGAWRTYCPVLDTEKCNRVCLQCWICCPDSSIIVKDGKFEGFDLMHCKGCGICAHECPAKAINMVEEKK